MWSFDLFMALKSEFSLEIHILLACYVFVFVGLCSLVGKELMAVVGMRWFGLFRL